MIKGVSARLEAKHHVFTNLAVFIVIHCFSCSNVLLAVDLDPASEIVIMFNLVPVSRLPRVMFCARFRMAFYI